MSDIEATVSSKRKEHRGLLNVEEAASMMGLSPRTLRRIICNKRMRHLRVGRLIRIYPDDVDEFLSRYVVEAAA